MSKIMINGNVFSSNDKEYIKDIKAIKKDNTITYSKDGIKVKIQLLDNKVLLERENDNMKLNLEFEESKKLVSKYVIKDLNLNIKIETKTNRLIIDKNIIKAQYDLFMNGEFSDNFIFELEWSEL
ncbi:MAG: DUF1934 family protein [Candidatus Aphodocola sp.]